MKSLFTRTNLTWFFLIAIVCGALAIVYLLVTSSAPPANAVLIDGAGAGRASRGSLDLPASSISSTHPTATVKTISIGEGQTTGQSGAQGAIAQHTPDTILGAPTPTPATVTIYISGAVAKPGVYTLAEGDRVQDAIAAAGGAMIEADLGGINLAQKLADEAHIIIGRRDEGTASSVQQPATSSKPVGSGSTYGQALSQPAGPEPTPSAPIDLNTATAAELESLPSIGPSLAARIVADREQYGPFHSVEDLTRVTGIKEGILSKIRDYITVSP
jgi:competence protein ComEA